MSGRTGLQLRKQFGRIHRVDGVPPGRRVEARRHLGSRFWQRWPDYRFRFCCFSAYFRLPPHPEPLSSACSKLRKQLSRASASRLVVLGSMYFRAEKSNGLFASIAAVAFVSHLPSIGGMFGKLSRRWVSAHVLGHPEQVYELRQGASATSTQFRCCSSSTTVHN